MTGTPAGLDPIALDRWLAEAAPEVSVPVQWTAIEGGRSNLTYVGVDAAGVRWVLRRPPLGDLPESAHDVLREQRIISALASTPVPVPRVVASGTDRDVIGVPFFVMAYVDGAVCRSPESATALGPTFRARAGGAMIEVLVALHALAPGAVGLGDLGLGEDYAARQIRRWRRQVESVTRRDHSTLFSVAERLEGQIPEQREITLVHGDFRLDNCLMGSDGTITAVLDWELATLGDPLSDLGLLMAYWAEPGDTRFALQNPATVVPGFVSRTALRDHYAELTRRDLEDLDFWTALAFWKLACIVEGVYTRLIEGAMGDASTDPAPFGEQARRLADLAAERLGMRNEESP